MPRTRDKHQQRPGDGVTNRADAAAAAGLDGRVRNQTVDTAHKVPRADRQRLALTTDPADVLVDVVAAAVTFAAATCYQKGQAPLRLRSPSGWRLSPPQAGARTNPKN